MFDSIGWGEILVLIVVGLFVLGPDRLPEGAAWLGRTIRQVKQYATGAREHLRSELGPEFDELRKPLEDLRGIRDFNPRSAVTKHLLDGENPLNPPLNNSGSTPPPPPKPQASPPLSPGERPPYDSDAT
ncbi:sec-independent translocase [Saccharopolyspora sp. MS10]|uniref:sec-independent translocase n=1 Tax=Saccharopolyspora sp. MS10 TaxID=3385973 RepID=UPI0039A0AF81